MQTHYDSPGVVTISQGPFAITFRKKPDSEEVVQSGISTLGGGRPSKKLVKKMAEIAKQALKHMAESGYKPQPHPHKPLFRITDILRQMDAFNG